jgi:DUF4097 and DUF4098 domain-containing protein YvlB
MIAALAVLLPVAGDAADEKFEWRGAVAPGQTLEIKGINGPIRAELANGAEIEVQARKTARRSDSSSVRIDVVPHGGGVTICSVYPNADDRPNECRPGREGRMNNRDNDVNVEYLVKVPAGVRLAANTVNGGIDAIDLRSEVTAQTVNGGIKVSTTELAQAKTVNGSIEATFGRPFLTAPLNFESVNGSIHLKIPATTNADVTASTLSGGIAADFPLQIEDREDKPQRASGRIGAGGQPLTLKTVNGRVMLNRQ